MFNNEIAQKHANYLADLFHNLEDTDLWRAQVIGVIGELSSQARAIVLDSAQPSGATFWEAQSILERADIGFPVNRLEVD